MRAFIFYFFTVGIVLVLARCPQTKKAHPTSCTLFYNCVHLPNGGYVWVPNKCADGLVFQPYLRLCVLPGDLWTCGVPSPTQAPLPARNRENEQIKRQDTSNYMEPTTPNSLVFSELMDHPFTTDAISENPDTQTITPYPLMEIEEATEIQRDKINPEKDTLCSQTGNKGQNTVGTYSLLSNLINHLLQQKEMTIPFETLISSTTSEEPGALPLSTVPIDLTRSTRHNVLTNYLIQNYIQQNNLHTTVISNASPENATTEVSINDILINQNRDDTGLSFSNLDSDSNIVLIKDISGNKQYLTIEKYQSHPEYLNSKYSTVVPCVRNIRLPNATDCIKYYTCDPALAVVMEYSCPQNTAFNKYSRVCDTESRVICTVASTATGALVQEEAGKDTTKPSLEKMCAELGKIKDPSSDFHYFICYAPSTSTMQIKSIRLACPNGLIFCQSKKFCTTKRLCTSSRK